VRTGRDLFFADELKAMIATCPEGLHVTIALSDEDVDATITSAHPEFAFDKGFVHAVAGASMKGRFTDVRAYAAGPPPLVSATLRMLLLEGKLKSATLRASAAFPRTARRRGSGGRGRGGGGVDGRDGRGARRDGGRGGVAARA